MIPGPCSQSPSRQTKCPLRQDCDAHPFLSNAFCDHHRASLSPQGLGRVALPFPSPHPWLAVPPAIPVASALFTPLSSCQLSHCLHALPAFQADPFCSAPHSSPQAECPQRPSQTRAGLSQGPSFSVMSPHPEMDPFQPPSSLMTLPAPKVLELWRTPLQVFGGE